MSDIKFGDWVYYKSTGVSGFHFLVIGHIVNGKIRVSNGEPETLRDDVDQFYRMPRPGEMILVRDSDNELWQERMFVLYDGNYMRCVAKDNSEQELVWWRQFKLKDSRDEKILDIVKKIESNDPETLRVMAEIILTAKEKVNE